jgi:hypothetical protein
VRPFSTPTQAFVGLGSDLDPPGLMERAAQVSPGPLSLGRRSAGSVAHPTEHAGGVRWAVVKIYHGGNLDRLAVLWRTTQEEADKEHPQGHPSPLR